MLFADVIIDISHEAVDKSFQYIVGDDLKDSIRAGCVLLVPFGKGNHLKRAYCIGLSTEAKIDPDKLKYVKEVKDDDRSAGGVLISLAAFMARTYGVTMAAALRTVIYVSKTNSIPIKRIVELAVTEEEALLYLEELTSKKRYSIPKERLLKALIADGRIEWELITGKLSIQSGVIRDLEKRGVLSVKETGVDYTPENTLKIPKKEITLNDEQRQAFDIFNEDFSKGIAKTYLLYGITGSGKTEVYIKMMEAAVEQEKDIIVLIPEIALTYQTLMRFYHKFGNLVGVVHSRLSPSERYDIFNRAKRGEIKIIVGPRSALFTPFNNLGLIIMDEEHEGSYKSEKSPRYHARTMALELLRLTGASLVLGSATPSIESFYHAKMGDYKLLTLKSRAAATSLPQCEIVDLREELKEGNRSILSRRLCELMEETLNRGKQIMVFINRRGMLSSVSCRSCGEVIKCPHCDVSLTLHRDKRLHCHYCGFNTNAPRVCPKCNSPHIGGFRAGTQKIEEIIKERFPKAGVIRMDADTTKGKEGHEKVLSIFANKGADILVGTQMIVKGHDFPQVALVGVLAADLSLNTGDFRAGERTFDLITQAAGRAGRAGKGSVVIQTYRPDSYAVSLAAEQDYDTFYEREMAYRTLMNYPPACHILLCMVAGPEEKKTDFWGEKIRDHIEKNYNNLWNSNVISPMISKIKDIHRRMIYIKAQDTDTLFKIREEIEAMSKEEPFVSVNFDIDPLYFN